MGQTSSLDVNDLVNHTPLPSLLTPYDAISAVFVSVECRRLLHPGPGPEQTHVIRRRIDEDTRKLFRAMGASDVEAIVHEMNGADGFAVCLAGGGALGAITGRAGGGDLDLFVDSRGSARALVTRVLATGRYAVVDPDGGHVRLGLAPTDWEPPTPRSSSVVPTGTGEGEAERRFPLSMTKGGSHAPHLEIGLKLVQRAGAGGGPTGAYDRRTVAGTTTRIAVSPIAIDVILLRDLRAHQKASTCAPLGWSSRPGTACPGRRLWSFDLSVCATAITPRPAAGTADFHLTDVMAVVYRSLRFVSTRTSPGRIPHSRRQHVYHVLRQERRLCALAGTPGLPGAERWALAIDSLAASQREESGHAAGLADPGPWPNPAAWHSALDDSHELQGTTAEDETTHPELPGHPRGAPNPSQPLHLAPSPSPHPLPASPSPPSRRRHPPPTLRIVPSVHRRLYTGRGGTGVPQPGGGHTRDAWHNSRDGTGSVAADLAPRRGRSAPRKQHGPPPREVDAGRPRTPCPQAAGRGAPPIVPGGAPRAAPAVDLQPSWANFRRAISRTSAGAEVRESSVRGGRPAPRIHPHAAPRPRGGRLGCARRVRRRQRGVRGPRAYADPACVARSTRLDKRNGVPDPGVPLRSRARGARPRPRVRQLVPAGEGVGG